MTRQGVCGVAPSGTSTLSTSTSLTRSRPSSSAANLRAKKAAVLKSITSEWLRWYSGVVWSETASPGTPKLAPSSVAPTVPEMVTPLPTFSP